MKVQTLVRRAPGVVILAMGLLLAGVVNNVVSSTAFVAALLFSVPVVIGLNVARVALDGLPQVKRLAAALTKDSHAATGAEWSPIPTVTRTPSLTVFAAAPVGVPEPLGGSSYGARASVTFQRVRVNGETTRLTVVAVDGPALAGTVAARRDPAPEWAGWAQGATPLAESPGGWQIASTGRATLEQPGLLARLLDLPPMIRAVVWKDGEVIVVTEGFHHDAAAVTPLLKAAAWLAGNVSTQPH